MNDGIEEGCKKYYIFYYVVIIFDWKIIKVRIVYDVLVKVRKGCKSFNECLYCGFVILEDFCGFLLWFRIYKVVLIVDIEKVFL